MTLARLIETHPSRYLTVTIEGKGSCVIKISDIKRILSGLGILFGSHRMSSPNYGRHFLSAALSRPVPPSMRRFALEYLGHCHALLRFSSVNPPQPTNDNPFEALSVGKHGLFYVQSKSTPVAPGEEQVRSCEFRGPLWICQPGENQYVALPYDPYPDDIHRVTLNQKHKLSYYNRRLIPIDDALAQHPTSHFLLPKDHKANCSMSTLFHNKLPQGIISFCFPNQDPGICIRFGTDSYLITPEGTDPGKISIDGTTTLYHSSCHSPQRLEDDPARGIKAILQEFSIKAPPLQLASQCNCKIPQRASLGQWVQEVLTTPGQFTRVATYSGDAFFVVFGRDSHITLPLNPCIKEGSYVEQKNNVLTYHSKKGSFQVATHNGEMVIPHHMELLIEEEYEPKLNQVNRDLQPGEYAVGNNHIAIHYSNNQYRYLPLLPWEQLSYQLHIKECKEDIYLAAGEWYSLLLSSRFQVSSTFKQLRLLGEM